MSMTEKEAAVICALVGYHIQQTCPYEAFGDCSDLHIEDFSCLEMCGVCTICGLDLTSVDPSEKQYGWLEDAMDRCEMEKY